MLLFASEYHLLLPVLSWIHHRMEVVETAIYFSLERWQEMASLFVDAWNLVYSWKFDISLRITLAKESYSRVYARFAITAAPLATPGCRCFVRETFRILFALLDCSAELFFFIVSGITTVHGRPPLGI